MGKGVTESADPIDSLTTVQWKTRYRAALGEYEESLKTAKKLLRTGDGLDAKTAAKETYRAYCAVWDIVKLELGDRN